MRAVWLLVGFAIIGTACAPPPPRVTAAPASASTFAVPTDLVGTWQRRDAYLVVGPTGSARFRWRTDWCGPEVPEPCDREVADGVLIGAHADITLSGLVPGAPSTGMAGAIVSADSPGLFTVGPVSIMRVSRDVVRLQQADRSLELCRPPRDLNFCDAALM
jgi:hypothetical protein